MPQSCDISPNHRHFADAIIAGSERSRRGQYLWGMNMTKLSMTASDLSPTDYKCCSFLPRLNQTMPWYQAVTASDPHLLFSHCYQDTTPGLHTFTCALWE